MKDRSGLQTEWLVQWYMPDNSHTDWPGTGQWDTLTEAEEVFNKLKDAGNRARIVRVQYNVTLETA